MTSTSTKLTTADMRRKKPITQRLLVPLDDDFEDRLGEAVQKLERANLLQRGVEEAKAELKELEDEIRANGLEFVFSGVGRIAFEELKRDNPPTDKQKAKDGNAEWNPETFPAALCAASCTNVDMDEDGWRKEVFESKDWGPGELRMLFDAALACNTRRRVVELGN